MKHPKKPRVNKAQARRLRELKTLIESTGDPRRAVRILSFSTLADLAKDIGVSRSSVNHTLGRYPGRENPPVRRALEDRLGLPQYSLDKLLEV